METRVPSSTWPPAHALLLVFLATTGGPSTLVASEEASVQQQGCVNGGRLHRSGAEVPLQDQPCLSCTCDRGRLLCHLRICPPLPDNPRLRPGCRLHKAVGDCCARLACGDAANSTSFVQPVLTNQVGRKDDDNELGHPSASLTPAFGRPPKKDGKGCWVDGAHFGDGSALPSAVRCQRCYCLKSSVRCIRPTCHLNIPGCAPQYNHGSLSCCPSSYDCAALAAQLSTTSTTTTTTSTTTLPPTTTNFETKGCLWNGRHFREGARLPSEDVCRSCFCVRGIMKCTHTQCSTAAPGCTPILQPTSCCPVAYDCSHLESIVTSTPIPNLTEASGSRVRDNDRVIDFAPEDLRQRYQKIRGNQNAPRGSLFRPLHRKPPAQHVDQDLTQDEPSLKPPRSTGPGIDMAAIRERGALWRRRLNSTRLRPIPNSQRASTKSSSPSEPTSSSTIIFQSTTVADETVFTTPSSTTSFPTPSTDATTTEKVPTDSQSSLDTVANFVTESSLQSTEISSDASAHAADQTHVHKSEETSLVFTVSTMSSQTQPPDSNEGSPSNFAPAAFGQEMAVSAAIEPELDTPPTLLEQVGIVAQAEPPSEEHEHGTVPDLYSHEESSVDVMMGGHEEVIPNAEPDAILDGDVFDYFREVGHISEHQHEAGEEHVQGTSTIQSTTISNQHHSAVTASSTAFPTTNRITLPSKIPSTQPVPLSPQPNDNLLTRRVGMRVQVETEGFRSPPAPRGSTRFLSSENGAISESTLPASESVTHQPTTETLKAMQQEVLGAPDAQPLPQAGVGAPDEVPGRSHSLLVIPFLPEDAVVEDDATNASDHRSPNVNLGGALTNVSTHLLSSTNLRSLEESPVTTNQSVTRMGDLYHHLFQIATQNQGEIDAAAIDRPAHIDFLGLPSPIALPHTTPSDQWKPLAAGELPPAVAGLEFNTPRFPIVPPSFISTTLNPANVMTTTQTDSLLHESSVIKSEDFVTESTSLMTEAAKLSETSNGNSGNSAEAHQALENVEHQQEEQEESDEGNQTETELEEDETEEPSALLGLLSLFGFTGLGGAPAESQTEKPKPPPIPAPTQNQPLQGNAADSGWTPLQVQQGGFHPVLGNSPDLVPGQPPIGLGIHRLPPANASGSFLVGQPKEELPDSTNNHHWQGGKTGKPIIERIPPPPPTISNHTPPSVLETTTRIHDASFPMHSESTEPVVKAANGTIATGSAESILHSLLNPLFRGDFNALPTPQPQPPTTVTQSSEQDASTKSEEQETEDAGTDASFVSTTHSTSHSEPIMNVHHVSLTTSDDSGSVEHAFIDQISVTPDVPTAKSTAATTAIPLVEAKEEVRNDAGGDVPIHGSALSNDAILSLLGLFNSHENHPKPSSQLVPHLPPHNVPPRLPQQPMYHPIGNHRIGGNWPPPPAVQHPPSHLPPPAHLYPQLANLNLHTASPTHQNFNSASLNLVLPQTILVTNNSVHSRNSSQPTPVTLQPTSITQQTQEDNTMHPTTTSEIETTTTATFRDAHGTRTKPFAFNPFIFKVEGCDIYGKFYNLGAQVTDLSGSCKVCVCTEYGVQCKKQC